MNDFTVRGAFLAFVLTAGTLSAGVVEVSPTGGNDTPSVTAAVAALKDGDTLRFAKGTYRFHPEGAERRLLLPCGSTGGERSVAMCFEGLSDIVVDGGGSTFIWHGDISPFAFIRCRRVEVRNFSSTLNRTSVIELMVESRDDDGFVLRAISKDVRLGDGALVFTTDLGEFSSAVDGRISLHSISRMLIGYLFVGDAPGPRTGLPSWHMSADAEDLGQGRYRFRYRRGDSAAVKCPYEAGELLGVNTEMKRERCTIMCDACSDVVFRDVTLRRGGGMGIVAQQCENLTLERYRVMPEPGEKVSLTADCIFLVNCRGRVLVKDCDIGHAFDDAMNCHGNYTRVDKAEGGRVTVSLCHPRHRFALPFRSGDRVEFIDPKTLAVVASRVVAETGRVSADGMSVELAFSEALPELPPETLVEDVSAHPDVVIRGCRFHDTMHLRLSGRGKYLVENNRFERGSGLLVIDLFEYWGEAGRINDMVIRNNVFKDFNSMSGRAFIAAGVSGFGENAPAVHRGLVITNNVYSGLVDKFTRLRGTEGAVVRDNREMTGAGRDIFAQGGFFIGCNYWAGHAGMYMWSRWRPEAVEAELAALAGQGVGVMRVFPLWSDFQPLTRVHGGGNVPKGFLQNNGPFANLAGVDPEMMRRFRAFCDMARKHDIRLIVGLVTGWMSGRMFVPPAFDSSNPLTDPECIMWQSRFIRHFVGEMKDHPAIAAWDFGNECNCMGKSSMAEFYNWMNVVGMSIRLADPSRPVVSGLHGCSTKMTRKAPIRNVAELSDVLCTHPYSFYVPGCGSEPLGTFRPTLHPIAESLLYRDIGGRPCFIEEIGSLGSSCNSEERSAYAMRSVLYNAWANDLKGCLWWCNADQEHLPFPPYDWISYERELGMLRNDLTPKPVMKEMKSFMDFIKSLPFERLPPRRTDSVIVVPERTDGWVAGFGAYLLARQAGLDPVFAGAEHELPESKLYVVCSAETDKDDDESYTCTAQRRILAKAKEGACVLLLYNSRSRFVHLGAEAGLVADYGTKSPVERKFALPARPDRKMVCRDEWTVRLKAAGCEVIAATDDGEPVFTRFANAKGTVLVCNSPIDREAVARTDVFTGDSPQPYYLFLEEARKIAGISRTVEKKDCPRVVITEHPAGDGKTLVVAVNCSTEDTVCPVTVRGRIDKVWRGKVSERSISLKANEAAVFQVAAP